MTKKLFKILFAIVAAVSALVPNFAFAQNTVFKVTSNTIQPVISTWSFQIPQLGGSGVRCIQVDNTGLFSVASAACGSGGGAGANGGTFSTSTNSAYGGVFNNYANNVTDIVQFGGITGTTTAKYFFDPNAFGGAGAFKLSGRGTIDYASSTAVTVSGLTYLNGGFIASASSTINNILFLTSLSQGLAFIGSNGFLSTVATTTLGGSGLISVTAGGSVIGASPITVSCPTCGTGTVTSVSVASANGLAGSSSGGATPALTLSTTITSNVLKGNGTAISGAVNGTDYTLVAASATCTNQFLRSVSAAGVGVCATVGSGDVSLANLTATDGTLTFSGTYNGSTARTIGLNLGNSNIWTASTTFQQQTNMAQASTSLLTIAGLTYLNGGLISLASSTLQNFTSQGATSTSIAATNLSNTLVKANAGGSLIPAVSGTDYSLISALSCSAGNHLATVTALGAFTCTADSGGGAGGVGFASTTATLGRTNGSVQSTADTYGIGTSTQFATHLLTLASSTGLQLVLSDATTNNGFSISTKGGEFDISTTSLTTGATSTNPMFAIKAGSAGVFVSSSTPFATLAINPVAGGYANQFVIGSSTATNFRVDNTGHVFAPNTTASGSFQTGYWCYDTNGELVRDSAVCLVSALKYKKNIENLSGGLAEVLDMRPVSYYKKDPLDFEDSHEQVGFIADEAIKVDPRLVTHDVNGDIRGFRYDQYTSILTSAIQELNARENWQWVIIIFLALALGYQQWKIKKLKRNE